jgi:hypothetical protein
MNVQFSQLMARDTIFGEAQKIDAADNSTVYYGYCAGDCTGTDDPRWLIKRLTYEGSTQTVEYANGRKDRFDQAWDNRATITYRLTPKA